MVVLKMFGAGGAGRNIFNVEKSSYAEILFRIKKRKVRDTNEKKPSRLKIKVPWLF